MAFVKKFLFKPKLELHGERNFLFHTFSFRYAKNLGNNPIDTSLLKSYNGDI